MSFGKNVEMINSFSGTFRSSAQAYIKYLGLKVDDKLSFKFL